MRVGGAWLDDPRPRRLLSALTGAGYAAYFVGGAVRNAAMGRPVGDIDIATAAIPETVAALAEAAGFTAVPTGIAHGTVTVIVDDLPMEVTTFRRDVETDGRHAVVAFSDDIAADAGRRDFTMNALYADAEGRVVDPLGGIGDALVGRVRFIGDARARIHEDYLRILRYFRFHGWYGDHYAGIDAEALAASAELAEGLTGISAERITAEMLKLLAAPDPAPAVAAMAQAGILARVIPGADAGGLAPLVHHEEAIGAAPGAIRRLAALGGERAALRLARRDRRQADLLVREVGGTGGAAEMAWRHGAGTARDIELLRGAIYAAPLPADLDARIARGAAAVFPVRGSDLEGFEGPALGRRLKELEQRWIASDFTLGRNDLLA